MSTENIVLTCSSLTVGYDGCRLCRDIAFSVHEGEYISVIGPDGVGKSALISTIMGVIKPIEGEVVLSDGVSRRDFGCVPQESLMQGTSVVGDIVISGTLGGMKKFFVGKRERETAERNMERLGVIDLAKRRFGELSGGQKQRVMIARALCSANKLLLLDEPMRGLDLPSQDALYETIVSLNRDDGTAVMVVDSNAVDGTVLHLSDRQLFLGSVTEYCASPWGKLFFLGRIV